VHGTARKQVASCPGRSHAGITSSAHPSSRQGLRLAFGLVALAVSLGLGVTECLADDFLMAPLGKPAMRSLSVPSALHLSITLAGDWCGRRPHTAGDRCRLPDGRGVSYVRKNLSRQAHDLLSVALLSPSRASRLYTVAQRLVVVVDLVAIQFR